MKLIHLSDLHIGKRVNEISMIEDQEYILLQILQIIDEELPAPEDLLQLMQTMDMPTSLPEIGISQDILSTVFRATKDIRDKYVLSFFLWDLGVTDTLLKSI